MATDSRLLGGRYELGEVLGYGGMAEVHIGRDVRLGRDVAIKLLRPDLARDPSFQGRFRREAQSAASLNHPSIVAVYDTGEDSHNGTSTPFIVMEYVEGRTLREVLEAEGRLLPQRALEITAQICAALDQAHRAGLVHRDVKPGNVMLTPSGEVKVMDFGIARAVTGSASTMTQTAAVIGTAHYLSPEQARGEHVDARSDVYSTGCLLYELLTGGPPFSGDSAVAVAYQHVREEPVPPSRIEPDVPPALDAIVLKAMAKNAANRYQTAGEMRADIERALAGRPVEATPLLAPDTAMFIPPPATTVLLRQPTEARRGRGAAYLLLALATIGIFLITLLAATHFFNGSSGGDVNTPNVVGQTLADAESTLAGKGLTVGKITQQYDTKVPKGAVISQDPPPDILLRKGQSVDLVVSLGVHIVTVPTDLVGLTEGEARARLKVAQLRVGQIVSRNSDAPAGQVLGTDPTGGAQVPENTAVTLFVSNARVKVPDVVGKDQATATSLLEQAGFVVVQQPAAVYDKKKPEGVVLAQSPSGGTFEKTGSQVQIFVNTKPPPSPSPSPSGSPTPAGSPSPSPSPSATKSP
jgi:beta-lactam-binding protein with PASTA domain/predicted Ser/Thr protein kinase